MHIYQCRFQNKCNFVRQDLIALAMSTEKEKERKQPYDTPMSEKKIEKRNEKKSYTHKTHSRSFTNCTQQFSARALCHNVAAYLIYYTLETYTVRYTDTWYTNGPAQDVLIIFHKLLWLYHFLELVSIAKQQLNKRRVGTQCVSFSGTTAPFFFLFSLLTSLSYLVNQRTTTFAFIIICSKYCNECRKKPPRPQENRLILEAKYLKLSLAEC